MHGASRFQSSRLRGYGYASASSDAAAEAAAATMAAAAAPATKKKGVSLTSEQGSEIISGIGGVLDTFITTVGGIETARITGKAPATSTQTAAASSGRYGPSGGGVSGGSGISGTALAVGGLVVVGLGVGAYFVFRRK